MYTNRNRGYKLMQILPELIKDYDKATKEKDSNKTQEVLEQLFDAIQEINETVDYSNEYAVPEDYGFIQSIILWIEENIPYSTNEKVILRDIINYFIYLIFSLQNIVKPDVKNKWNEVLEKIYDLFNNELLIE